MAQARLRVLSGPQAGEEVDFVDSLLIGRSNAVGLALKDATVSREHARLFHRAGQWFVVDLKSSNGTHVAGRTVSRAELRDGDEFALGAVQLRFALLREERPPAASAPEEQLEIELPGGGAEEAPVVRTPAAPPQPSRLGSAAVRRLEAPAGGPAPRMLHQAGPGLMREDLSQWGFFPKALVILAVVALGAALFYCAFRLASGV